jgi:hypothetical protein
MPLWDKLPDLDIFPQVIAKREIKYYLTRQNTYEFAPGQPQNQYLFGPDPVDGSTGRHT